MGRHKLFLTAVIAAVVLAALAIGPASAFAGGWPGQQQALFVQTDNLSANSIMVYDRSWNGTLSLAGSYLTGGMGGQAAGSHRRPARLAGLTRHRRRRATCCSPSTPAATASRSSAWRVATSSSSSRSSPPAASSP